MDVIEPQKQKSFEVGKKSQNLKNLESRRTWKPIFFKKTTKA
jgi:hypothetical protein